MADKDVYEADLANQIHNAERAVAKATAAPAGPTRVADVGRAEENLLKLQQQLDHCLSGQASPPIKLHR
jgi:hypothetical protein